MKILIVSNSKLPALKYGGTQRVVWSLAKELNLLGHDVTLLAAKGTVAPFAQVIEINPSLALHQQIPDYIDVVHFNGQADPLTRQPYIVTIHGNKIPDDSQDRFVYVSENHANRNGSTQFVHNGLDWSEYGKVDLNKRREHFHFLGNAAWRVKNLKGAIRITKAIDDATLGVLGGHRLNFKMGFRLTLSPRIKFYGMVSDQQKPDIILRSKGLIFPVLWDEPFGLAITESLFFGSPVYGSLRGSLPELVNNDVGFLSNNESDIIQAIKAGDYSPQHCHQYASDCFNSRVMALRYIEKYEMVMNHNRLL